MAERNLMAVTEENAPTLAAQARPHRRRRAARDVVPFGQYRGRPVRELLADIAYCSWLLDQPWLGEKYPALRGVVQATVDAYETDGDDAADGIDPMSPERVWMALSADQKTAVRVCAPELAAALEASAAS